MTGMISQSRNYLSHFRVLSRLSIWAIACLIFLESPTQSAELLIGNSCPTLNQVAVDWDTIAECQLVVTNIWQRQPFYIGATSDSCDSSHAGMLQWTGSSMQYCNYVGVGTSSWSSFYTGGTNVTTAISGLTQSVAPNTFDNQFYAQTWAWNGITGGSGLILSSTTETTGSILTLNDSNGGSSTGPVFNLSNSTSGAGFGIRMNLSGANSGYAGYFNNSSPTGWGIYSVAAKNSFTGAVNLALGKGYQINGTTILTFPASDTTSVALGGGALAVQSGANQYNVAAGVNALTANTSGFNNTAIGYQSLYSNVSGSNSTALGYQALYSMTSGPNDALGYDAGYNITIGTQNVGIGANAMYGGAAITGSSNVAVGSSALYSIQGAAANNTALGYNALYSSTTASNNTAVGYQALYKTTSSPNDALGWDTGYYITTGINNVAMGYKAMGGTLAAAITGNGNTAIGDQALYSAQGAVAGNVGIGYNALFNLTSGTNNTAFGSGALLTSTASSATAFGYFTLNLSTSGLNDAFGYQAGEFILTGASNAAFGQGAITSITGANELTGNYSTAVGYNALHGIRGTSVGNTGLGYLAGDSGTVLTTGTFNTLIGYQAAITTNTITNATVLGNGASASNNNNFILGNTSITNIYAQPNGITTPSDRRLKKDIADLTPDLGLDFITKLKPVSYRLKNGDETERFGFIAQDLEQALPRSLQHKVETASDEHGLALIDRLNDKDRTYQVSYSELTAPIVKAVQVQQEKIVSEREKISLQSSLRNRSLHQEIGLLTQQIENQDRLFYIIVVSACCCGLLSGALLARRKGAH